MEKPQKIFDVDFIRKEFFPYDTNYVRATQTVSIMRKMELIEVSHVETKPGKKNIFYKKKQ